MNRRMTGATLAILLALSVPAAAVRAADPPGAAPPPAMGAPRPPNPPPRPEPKITSAQAEAALKEFFTLPPKSAKVDWQWNLSNRGDKRVWDLQVTIREGNGAMGFQIASVDAVTGRVLNYGGYGMLPGPVRVGPLGAVHTEDETRVRAWSLVQKLAPDQAAGLMEAPAGTSGYMQRYYGYGYMAESTADAYNFTWIESHDGVPFPSSSVSVGVQKQTLDYVFVNVNLVDSIQFQAGPAKVTSDQALHLWQTEARPSLSYQAVVGSFPYMQPKASEYKLIYRFPELDQAVDAITGTWAPNPSPFPPAGGDTRPAAPEAVPAGSAAPVVPEQLPLTDAAALKLALAVLEVPQGVDLRADKSFFGDEKLFQFSYFDKTGTGTIMLEPNTGLIRNANRSQGMGPTSGPPGNPEQKQVTPEQEAQAKQAAIAVVQSYYSQIRDQLRLESVPPFWGPQDNQVRRFQFVRYVGGVAVPTDSVMVAIDLSTLRWAQINANWTTGVTFPSPAGAITPEKAKETVLANRKPMLVYRPVYPAMSPDQMGMGAPQPAEATLVYLLTPQTGSQVDALTGQILGYDALGISDFEAAAKKVTGHWAEGALQFMLSRRIIRPEQLDPDAALTRGQAVALLLNRTRQLIGVGPLPTDLPYTDLSEANPAYGAVRMAWSQGWLRPLGDAKTFQPDAPITRAEFVVWAARAMGLGDLARSGLTVQAEYQDLDGLTTEQRNAASFLRALGLLSPADTFRGGDPLTQAEGAALTVRIYNDLLTA